MPATQVTEGVHRLTQGVVNFYLVEEGGRLLLVDAGAPRDWDLLVGAVAALGRRIDDLEAVLLTHAHADHIGTAERARATASARVWVHQADEAMARSGKATKTDGKVRTYLLRAEFYRTLFSLARRGATRIVPVRELATFADGETLELPGRDGPQIMPSGLNSDTPQALRSLTALDGIPADVLLPGHGEPWTEGAAEALRLARAAGPS
jgi:glyoxylase-like metal-dependent hydrolase (beta-lactamase superfamily II)